jgi:hypothetical protein
MKADDVPFLLVTNYFLIANLFLNVINKHFYTLFDFSSSIFSK